jgi:hypothetical protein
MALRSAWRQRWHEAAVIGSRIVIVAVVLSLLVSLPLYSLHTISERNEEAHQLDTLRERADRITTDLANLVLLLREWELDPRQETLDQLKVVLQRTRADVLALETASAGAPPRVADETETFAATIVSLLDLGTARVQELRAGETTAVFSSAQELAGLRVLAFQRFEEYSQILL